MNEEQKQNGLSIDGEPVLDFEEAKELTVEEALRKHEEIKAGVLDTDSLLDKYIKQHREEIEAQKFETQRVSVPSVEFGNHFDVNEEFEAADTPVSSVHVEQNLEPTESAEETIVAANALKEEELIPLPNSSQDDQVYEDDWGQAEEEKKERKKKIIVWSAVGTLFSVSIVSAFLWMNQLNQGSQGTSSSSATTQESTSQSSTSTSSTATDAKVAAFDELYKTFFTDESATKLKNSEFGKLEELKKLLDALDKNSDAYKTAKEKYDQLEKAIAAVTELNNQFDKPVLVNGEIDTTATAKATANLVATTSGMSSVDSVIASVVNFGRSQQENATTVASSVTPATPAQSTPASSATVATSETTPSVSSGGIQNAATQFGIPVPAGVVLQRELSRVPYNQDLINDVNNPSWTFNPGILENIVAISQQRGYITGNQYILEKVNIINGNGYYNMFKPDGTYLFSINCKTGYFVGNGAGHSDALDY
ncbi:cell division site-positioning protein MapZ family protein [Streptococcus suis]|uniref:cell division site-positioning protein MapZ family protein n=2 Tax=Streptococcus suis TaxID=1307 RepID=UPI002AAC3225|nr:cell division site-positioning protein MapZ family protein [Streptococcus suis]